MATKTEDLELLKYAGLMGHECIGIIGEPGERRKSCETNSIDSAKRLCSEPNLRVYRRGDLRKKNDWLCVYDRPQETMGLKASAEALTRHLP